MIEVEGPHAYNLANAAVPLVAVTSEYIEFKTRVGMYVIMVVWFSERVEFLDFMENYACWFNG